MSRVKNAALLTLNQFIPMDMPTVSLAEPTSPVKNLDYYDQLEVTECYCEDTLFAFGSEDYLSQPVLNTESTETETSFASITTMLKEFALE